MVRFVQALIWKLNLNPILVLTLILTHGLGISLTAEADCKSKRPDEHREIEQINQRYDDFFKHRAHDSEREQVRNHGRHHLHTHDLERAAALERARLTYLQTRKAPVDHDGELERQMEHARKEREHSIEIARECYVHEQSRLESITRRGRTVPEKQEYDLED